MTKDEAREAAASFLESWEPGPEMTVVKLARAFQAAIDAQRERDAKEYIQAGIDAAADAMEADAKLCDCFARSEGECGCGAWSDYKTVPVSRMVDLVRGLDATAIRSAKP
jgi:hypothetical protein